MERGGLLNEDGGFGGARNFEGDTTRQECLQGSISEFAETKQILRAPKKRKVS